MGSLAAAPIEVTLIVGFNIYDMIIGLLGGGHKIHNSYDERDVSKEM